MPARPVSAPDLGTLPFFSGIPEASLAPLAAEARGFDCPRGHAVFRQGDPSTHTWFVVRGRVKLHAATPEGVEVVLDHLGPGDCFGIVGVVGPMPRQSTATVTARALLVGLPTGSLQALMEARPELLARVLRQLVSRLAHSTREKVVLASQRVYGRLALKLLVLSRPSEGGRRLPTHLSHRELAALIGSTRATVTRAFQELRRQGIVEEDEHGVVIRREETLKEMVDWHEPPGPEGHIVP